MAITSVLVVGISSAIVVATRAVNAPASAAGRTRSAAEVAELIARNLSLASSISEAQQNSICVSAFDDDGDGTSQEICYEWGGTIGDPLIRKVDGEAFTILEDVRLFTLSYTPVTQGESARDDYLAGFSASKDLVNYKVSQTKWIAQSFTADLPAGATGWKPKRVELRIRKTGGTAGQVQTYLSYPDVTGGPGGAAIGSGSISESELFADYAWISIAFTSSLPTFNLGQRLWVVILGTVDSPGELAYYNKFTSVPNWQMRLSSNGGTSWSTMPKCALLFKVYGTITGTSAGNEERVLSAVRVSLAAGDDESTRIDTGVNLLNLPMWDY